MNGVSEMVMLVYGDWCAFKHMIYLTDENF